MPGFANALSSEGRYDRLSARSQRRRERADNRQMGASAADTAIRYSLCERAHPQPRRSARRAHRRDVRRRSATARAAGGDQSRQAYLQGNSLLDWTRGPVLRANPRPGLRSRSCQALSEALAGEQILIDQNAWLRAAWRPGGPGNWTNPQALAAVVRDIAAHPIAADAGGGHVRTTDIKPVWLLEREDGRELFRRKAV